MKTKHFFYSMALIAALGACSSENLEVTNTDVQDLSIRPLVGDVELTVGDAQTRFATGTGAQPVFDEGDKLGACIIDVPNYGAGYNPNADAVGQYNIVEYYSSNNAFTYDGSIWKVDQPLVEGNYLFYAPYNQKMQARTPLSIKVPVKQTATSEKAALDEFYKSGAVVRVGYQFLAANDGVAQKPKVTMNDVFAYPLFTIKNNFKGILDGTGVANGKVTTYNGGTIKLDSIQIHQVVTANQSDVTVTCGGVLKHAQDAVAATTANEGVVGMMKPEGQWDKSPMESYTKNLLSTKVVDNNAGSATNRDRTGGVITTLVCNKEIAAGGEYKVHGVLPAMAYTDATNSMRVALFVTIGDKHYKIEDATVTSTGTDDITYTPSVKKGGILLTSAAGTVTLIKGQKYPQEELNFENGRLTAKSSAGQILTIDLKGGFGSGTGADAQVATEFDASTPAPAAEIKTNADFEAFFKEQLNGTALTEAASTQGAQFKLATNNTLTINSAMIDALFTYNNKGTLKFNTALPIDKDVKITNISSQDVTFKSANNKEYTIELGTNYLIATTTAAVNVGETKTVIINGACTTFTNVGTIKTLYVVAAKSLTTSAAVTVQGSVINDGTITVANGLALTPTSLVNSKDATLEVNDKIGNLVENNGLININNPAANVVVSAGNGTIEMAEANKAATVIVNGGIQEGIYTVTTFDKDKVKAGDAIAWVNAVKIVGTAAFAEDIVAEMKDIKTVYATSATFSTATFDMANKTLVLSGSSKAISGTGILTSIVKNINILNTSANNVTLSNIAASGNFSNTQGVGAKIIANGTDATWNGEKAE